MKYKLLHLPTGTFMCYSPAEKKRGELVLYSEYETITHHSYSDVFTNKKYLLQCITQAIAICKMDPKIPEYEFENGLKLDLIREHLQIIEVNDV